MFELSVSLSQQVHFLKRLKGNCATDYRVLSLNLHELHHPKHLPKACSLSLVSVGVYFLQLTGRGQRLSPSTNHRKAESAIRICMKEVKITAFARLSLPSNQCQFYRAATIQLGDILPFSPADAEESLRRSLECTTQLQGTQVSSELVKPLNSFSAHWTQTGRKKSKCVNMDGLETCRSLVSLVSWFEASRCQGGYCTVCQVG